MGRYLDEFLRYTTPVNQMARTVTKSASLGGCPMQSGDKALLVFAAANRDPAAFPDPDSVVLDRSPNRHLAFGSGPHRCVGSHYARGMVRVATIAFGEAVHAVQTGRFGTVLALGLEQMSTAFDGAIHPNLDDTDGASGLALPGLYAMAASRYLATGRATERQLAAVAVKNRGNAIHNERAHFAGQHTIDEVLGSRMIADPLTLLQCCPTSDGAAAAVVAPATGRAGEIRVRGVARGTGGLWDHRSDNVWGYDLIAATAQQAYAEADLVDTDDIDVAEMHDAFTISEIATSEALGLLPVGYGGAAAESGRTALGGRLPINPSGGLLSRGHPLGASGLAQLAEIVWQLRGQAGGRQVDGARLGLVETMGGGTAGLDGNACVVTVLEAG